MTPKYFLSIGLIVFSLGTMFGQTCSCGKMYFYIDAEGFDKMYRPFCITPFDTITNTIYSGHYYKCIFSDCKGEMKFYGYTDSVLVVEGNYVNSLDTFKRCSVTEDPNNIGKFNVTVMKYFQPLKNGVWVYYNKKGIEIKEETWDKGILVSTKNISPKQKEIKAQKE